MGRFISNNAEGGRFGHTVTAFGEFEIEMLSAPWQAPVCEATKLMIYMR